MSTRKELEKQIKVTEELIQDHTKDLRDLKIQLLQVNDEVSTYKEGYEDVEIYEKRRKTPTRTERRLIGRRYFTQYFEDESTGEKVAIDRKLVVREDDNWYLR